MLRIAVCDDEKYYQNYIKRLVLNEFKMRKICCEVDLFDSGINLLHWEKKLQNIE